MGLFGTVLQCVFGTIACVLRLGPFLLKELLFGKALPPFQKTEGGEDALGARLLEKNDKSVEEGTFKDVYLTSKDGTRLHAVVDTGKHRKNGKRPLVFVHGFPELYISWIDQLKYFAIEKGHPVVALNMRGYGMSEKTNFKGAEGDSLAPFHLFDRILEDIRAAVQHAATLSSDKSKAPLLAAHDWGASVCWAYACQGKTTEDKEIAGYAALSVPPSECFVKNVNLQQIWASLYMLFFNMPWLPEQILLARQAWFVGVMMNATYQAKLPVWMTNAYRSNCLQKGAMTAQLNYYRSALQMAPKPDPKDVLGPKTDKNGKQVSPGRRLDLPVLMIRGKQDEALTEQVFVGFDAFLSNARLVAFDRCSHWIQADCPNEVNKELEQFLEELNAK